MSKNTTEIDIDDAGSGSRQERLVMPMPSLNTAEQCFTNKPMCPHCGVYVDTVDDGVITDDTAIKRQCDSCGNDYILGGHYEFEFDIWKA